MTTSELSLLLCTYLGRLGWNELKGYGKAWNGMDRMVFGLCCISLSPCVLLYWTTELQCFPVFFANTLLNKSFIVCVLMWCSMERRGERCGLYVCAVCGVLI